MCLQLSLSARTESEGNVSPYHHQVHQGRDVSEPGGVEGSTLSPGWQRHRPSHRPCQRFNINQVNQGAFGPEVEMELVAMGINFLTAA